MSAFSEVAPPQELHPSSTDADLVADPQVHDESPDSQEDALRAAARGHCAADMAALAEYLRSRGPVLTGAVSAIGWHMAAAHQGHKQSMLALRDMARTGEGCMRNEAAANKWAAAAALAVDAPAPAPAPAVHSDRCMLLQITPQQRLCIPDKDIGVKWDLQDGGGQWSVYVRMSGHDQAAVHAGAVADVLVSTAQLRQVMDNDAASGRCPVFSASSMPLDKLFLLAARLGHTSAVRTLLHLGQITRDTTPAVPATSTAVMGTLHPRHNEDYAFRVACMNGHVQVVRELLQLAGAHRVDVHALEEHAFRLACQNGNVDVVELLLSLTGDRRVNVAAERHEALQRACEFKRVEVVRRLLDLSDERATPRDIQEQLFKYALAEGHAELAEVIRSSMTSTWV